MKKISETKQIEILRLQKNIAATAATFHQAQLAVKESADAHNKLSADLNKMIEDIKTEYAFQNFNPETLEGE